MAGQPGRHRRRRSSFEAWAKLGIGISFRKVDAPEDAMVRIGFDQQDGSWSYVGRDVLGASRRRNAR
jgi:hypothetical protein